VDAPPAASQTKISSMNISQTTSGQHIPARKANRSPPIHFASCAIFLNVTTLLIPSIAEQIPKVQKSNNPSVASYGLGWCIVSTNGGVTGPKISMAKNRWNVRPSGQNTASDATPNSAMKAVAAPRPSANASDFFPPRNKKIKQDKTDQAPRTKRG
jgi:hypothetical protein